MTAAHDAYPRLSSDEAFALAEIEDHADLVRRAGQRRDSAHGNVISYSRKVFIPLTQLCRDVCGYCTFAKTPRQLEQAYLTFDQIRDIARRGRAAGCREALFTLGDKPELRYGAARAELDRLGFATTLDYLHAAATMVLKEFGLLPHINAGVMSADDMASLRAVSVSHGLMLESVSDRLMQRGGAHHGSPDKDPGLRLETIRLAGELAIPFTSGILVGIEETRAERIASLLALRELNDRYGHIQEVIIQNFLPKPGTRMAGHSPLPLDEHVWTIAAARLIFDPDLNIQAPPNLRAGSLKALIAAGINDWGGVSPVTPDHVNPEAPWPHLETLAARTRACGKELVERLAIYPAHARDPQRWIDPALRTAVLRASDTDGFVRTDQWSPGMDVPFPRDEIVSAPQVHPSSDIGPLLAKARRGATLSEAEIVRLFRARGSDFHAVCKAADELRQSINGNVTGYVVTRNINYTNICAYRCKFCAFSKGKTHEALRGKPYELSLDDVATRAIEAAARGATEVCMQGGIHPSYTGETYLSIVRAVKKAVPEMHVHAFSPLEIWQGARTIGASVEDFLIELRQAGLGSLPGTAAEILDDEVRAILCPDKITTGQWLDVIGTAHRIGLHSTATIMFGHIERLDHWARHMLRLRLLQEETGGFTELVPLPFVHMESPIFLKGQARRGPSAREAILMHAVGRLALHPVVPNIQASWVKMGANGLAACLKAGANDLGGTLMEETISRAAGASHGQEMTAAEFEALARANGRRPFQRTTLYRPVEHQRARIDPACGIDRETNQRDHAASRHGARAISH